MGKTTGIGVDVSEEVLQGWATHWELVISSERAAADATLVEHIDKPILDCVVKPHRDSPRENDKRRRTESLAEGLDERCQVVAKSWKIADEQVGVFRKGRAQVSRNLPLVNLMLNSANLPKIRLSLSPAGAQQSPDEFKYISAVACQGEDLLTVLWSWFVQEDPRSCSRAICRQSMVCVRLLNVVPQR